MSSYRMSVVLEGYFVLEITWDGASAVSEEVIAYHLEHQSACDDCDSRQKIGPDGERVTFTYAPASAFSITWRKKS